MSWSAWDTVVAFSWVLVYILSIISTLKSKVLAIAPLGTAIAIPWELCTIIYNLHNGIVFNYAFAAQIGWAGLETALYVLILVKYTSARERILLPLLTVAILLLDYFVIFRLDSGQLFMSFFETFVGVFFWILWVMRPSYPANKLNLCIAGLTVFADFIGGVIYFWQSGVVLRIVIALVLLENLIHCSVVWYRMSEHRRTK